MTDPINDEMLRWLEVIFAERFGHVWHFALTEQGFLLTLEGNKGAILFDNTLQCLTHSHSNQPCAWWDAGHEGWDSVLGVALPAPGATELPKPLIVARDDAHIVSYDIPSLVYWMLARVEEIGRKDLDSHERFPATSSHAYRHGYLERPVVDEWLHVLGQVIQRQWPEVQLKQHEFQMRISHDVDQPSMYAFKPWKTILRMMASHILKRFDTKAFLTAPYVKLTTRNHLLDVDPYNTFNWLMDISERNGLKSAFYFICGRTHPDKDADYEIEHPVMRELLRRIHSRGHQIGLHPSYNTFRNPSSLKSEARKLKHVCAEEGINQSEWGGRMHYLRWDQAETLCAWADAGMSYDSTLGYADRPGFRCGTCFEYPAFDPISNKQIAIRIRPLHVMESTVIDSLYMGLGVSGRAFNKILEIKNICRMVNGQFALLWHNSYLKSDELKKLYLHIVSR